MPEEPMAGPDAAPPEQAEAEPSTDLVVLGHRTAAAPAPRWSDVVVRVKTQLTRLRQDPAAMVALSAAATVGSAVVTAGLRRALREMPRSSAERTGSVAVAGYLVHQVHVIHRVVVHQGVVGARADHHRARAS
jgi:hypothetical protein